MYVEGEITHNIESVSKVGQNGLFVELDLKTYACSRQVFKEIVFNEEKSHPFKDFVVQKWVISQFLHFWGVFSNVYEKLPPWNKI